MRDVEDQAKALLVRARKAAERLLVEAQREGEEIRKRAHVEGLADGRREGLARGTEEGQKAGRQQAIDEQRAQIAAAVAALTAAAESIEMSRNDLESAALQEVVELSIAIARRVTKRQGLLDPAVLTENLREAMRIVVHAGDVKVAIHPAQRQTLDAVLPALKLQFPKVSHVELVDDDTLSPGGCRVFAGGGQVDADLEVQLDRVVADLLPERKDETRGQRDTTARGA
jgi:flagellar assembly protein FliH